MAHPPLRHLRSAVDNARPDGALMAEGQIAMNYAAATPAMFIKDSAGQAVKVGPTHVGATAPNATPAGSAGNSLGESWLDTSGAEPVFKVWDGAQWVAAGGGGGATVTTDDVAPAAPSDGDLWWDSASTTLFVWYDDGDSAQWVQIGGGGSGGGGGTATAIVAGEGLTGGTITETGAVALDTVYTDGRYVNVTGDTMTGALGIGGTTAAPNITLSADGQVTIAKGLGTAASDAGALITPFGGISVKRDGAGSAEGNAYAATYGTQQTFAVQASGNLLLGGTLPTSPNIALANTGLVTLGGTSPGIKFPGTAVAATDANTLDDYEEGTWTPAYVSGNNAWTYTTQVGRYVKVGSMVELSFYITATLTSLPDVNSRVVIFAPFTFPANEVGVGSCFFSGAYMGYLSKASNIVNTYAGLTWNSYNGPNAGSGIASTTNWPASTAVTHSGYVVYRTA